MATLGSNKDDPKPAQPARSARACLSCRQMKMKCDGANSPPCSRCRKAKRACMFAPPPPLQLDYSRPLQPSMAFLTPPSHLPTPIHLPPLERSKPPDGSILSPGRMRFEQNHTIINSSIDKLNPILSKSPISTSYRSHSFSDLPSIYSTPPTEVVRDESPHGPDQMSSVPSRKRQKLESGPTGESLGPSSERQESEKDSDWVLENRAEARENIDFFREKLVVFIPALSPKDFLDTERLIEKELSLVHCICYVTAKFLPGGENTQKKLHHKVSTITILDRFTVGDRDEEMSRMKALVILCCYAVVSSPNLPVRSNEISFWSLKSFIQLYAKQISLYKSIHELRAEITSNRETPIYETDAYQRYALWLQIFLLSHYSSITSGTPPDVMIDSTIRAVSWVMQEIGMHPQLRLLAEVELCLVWEKASSRKPELREWWCIHPDDISDTDDENLTEYALREAETEIESWRSKWQGYMHSPGVDGSILDYHSRTVRFYFSSYAVRRLRKSSQGLSDLQRDQVQRCVTNANHVLEWLLTRSPIQKERIRYVSESSCTMISFCCFFIIASCQTFTSSLQGIDETLGNVIDTAALLMNLSPKEHNAHRQGMVVLQRAEKLRAALERSASQETGVAGSGVPRVAGPDHPHLPTPGPSEEGFHADWTELGMGQDEPFSVDGFWDFSMFLPNAW